MSLQDKAASFRELHRKGDPVVLPTVWDAWSAKVAAEASDAKTSTGLKPKRRMSGVVAGLIPILPTNTAATRTPARSGSQPKPFWNISGSRKGTALMVRR